MLLRSNLARQHNLEMDAASATRSKEATHLSGRLLVSCCRSVSGAALVPADLKSCRNSRVGTNTLAEAFSSCSTRCC
jgi:hypothetical protein